MQAAPRPAAPAVFPERRHGSLRLFASSCILSAWLSLILSVLLGISLFATPAPPLPAGISGYGPIPSPYGGGLGADGLGNGPSVGIGTLLPVLSGLRVVGGLLTIGGGVLTFFCLAALGHAIYLLLDMEENTRVTAQAMAAIARRMGT